MGGPAICAHAAARYVCGADPGATADGRQRAEIETLILLALLAQAALRAREMGLFAD